MNKIGVLYHPKVLAAHNKAIEIIDYLKTKGITHWLCSAWEKEKAHQQMDGTDMLVTVGGDGTILRAAQVIIPGTVPILSVNLGRLGFLTELQADEALDRLPEALDKKYWIDERAMLQAEVVSATQQTQLFHALNDVVVARGAIARLISVEASVDGQPLTTYRADGVITATATGSTGYALAVHGPVLYPQSRDLVLAPVAPHLGLMPHLVLPETAVVTLHLNTYLAATLSVDGHINLPLGNDDTVTVRRSPHSIRFVKLSPGGSFYNCLEERLKG